MHNGNHGTTEALKRFALELGFRRVGVARAGRSPHADRYLAWVEAGRHGTMDYMAKKIERRIDPRESLEGARSIIVVALPYDDDVEIPQDPSRGKIARYARGRDYHKVMPPMLAKLAEFVGENDQWRTWYTVDTAPILERDWAEAAGIGWIGKNALVIDPEFGSYFFLGLLITDREYEESRPVTDHCGSCRACLDACPTDAFVGERSVDANRCISYLTIEHKGDFSSELAGKLEQWVFGCDICQEVCPFNQRSGRVRSPVHEDLKPRPLPDRLDELSRMHRDSFLSAFAGTPVMRTGDDGMRRNALAAKSSS